MSTYYTHKDFDKESYPRYLIKREYTKDNLDSNWFILTRKGWSEIHNISGDMVRISKKIAEKIIMILELQK